MSASLFLPQAPQQYSQYYVIRVNQALATADLANQKIGADVNIGKAKLVLTASDGSKWKVVVSTSGVLSAVAV